MGSDSLCVVMVSGVVVVFCGGDSVGGSGSFCLSSWFFAPSMANLRPQNLPLSSIYRKFYYFFHEKC